MTIARATRYAATILAVVLGSAVAKDCDGQQASETLIRKLATPSSARWRGAPGRQAIERLAAETSTPVWIDRRVDVRKEIELTATNKPLAAILDEIAASLELGAAAVDCVVYIGPTDSAAALPLLARRWRQDAPSALKIREPLRWPRLSEPRKLAEEIAATAGYRIENPEIVPHDLWPTGGSPPLAIGDQLTLLCLGFDLHWSVPDSAQKTIRLEAVGDPPSRQPTRLASLIGSQPAPRGETRYTLRIVEQPIGSVIKQLATQFGLGYESSAEADALNQRVSFTVQQATLEELLEAAGEAANLDISVTDSTLMVRPLP